MQMHKFRTQKFKLHT